MASLVVFLNELSWTFAGIHRSLWATHIQASINAARSIRRLRSDLCVAMDRSPNAIILGGAEEAVPLGAVIGGGRYEDEWNFLRDIFQTYPNDVCPEEFRPGPGERVLWNGINAEAMAWAEKAKSFVISFGYPPTWDQRTIDAVLNKAIPSLITVRNIAVAQHVEQWTADIQDYGIDFSASSLVYEGADFAVRMYLNDHNPPHIHVFRNSQTQLLLARLNVVTMELMEGTPAVLPIRSQLLSWARQHQNSLRQNWDRCRSGQLPTKVGNP